MTLADGKHLPQAQAQVKRWAAYYEVTTHCKNGHEWTPENTGRSTSTKRSTKTSGRVCKTCAREAAKERYWADVEATRERKRVWINAWRAKKREST